MTTVAPAGETAGTGAPTRWTAAAYAYAAVVIAGFGYFLAGVPIQVTDSYGNIVKATHGTLGSLVYGEFYQRSYLRPFLWGTLRVVLDASRGHYYVWFRGLHVAMVALLIVLFVRLLRPRTWAEAAAIPVGLAALLGMHTFAGAVREAFPINTFLTILLCCFAAADLALGPPRWWRTGAALLVLVFAALTVESGLLVAVVLVAAYLAGARGVSRAGVVTTVALVAGYLALRFLVLHIGSPGLEERSSGFGFARHDPDDLIRMFGGNPLPFYAYNVLSSFVSVLFAEPRGGLFAFTGDLITHRYRVYEFVNVAASTIGTCLIAAYAWRRRREWRHPGRGAQLVTIFVAVALANAAISYAYTKDVILSPAGAFFAVALAVATADLVSRVSTATSLARVSAAAVVLLALSGTWAFRAVGIHLGLRDSGRVMRNEWAYVDQWLEREHQTPTDPAARALEQQLQDDAVLWHPSQPRLAGHWVNWFED